MSTENSAQDTTQTTASDSSSQTTSTTSDSVSTGSTSATSAQAGASATQNVSGDGQTQAVPAQPTYVPNYKFKAFDKEHEFEEHFKSFITDKDKEEAFRKLHAKAYGLEPMKELLTKTRSEFDGYKSTIEPKVKSYDFLNTVVQNKDWSTFFTKLNVPRQEIFDWVSREIEILQAPHAQQQEYQKQNAIREQAYLQQSQFEELNTKYQAQAVQTRAVQLESILSRADVTKYATAWDERSGQVGAFRQLVIDEAAAIFHLNNGRDLSPEEAINHVINKFGKVIPVQASEVVNQPGMLQAPKQVPIIPNISGKGTSPVKKVPKSLDDLREMAKALES